jgi:hypothetical protein
MWPAAAEFFKKVRCGDEALCTAMREWWEKEIAEYAEEEDE